MFNVPGECAVGDFGMCPYPPILKFVQGTMPKLVLSPPMAYDTTLSGRVLFIN